MPLHLVSVDEHSPAQRLGLEPGCTLLAIDGNPLNDALDYQFYTSAPHFTLTICQNGAQQQISVEKGEYEPFGCNFKTYLGDEKHSCANHCMFCFIDQLPPGMREPLYFKDDDERLSFLYGNYITMTNLTDREVERIIKLHISPIFISVHTTNPQLRVRMMANKRAAETLRYLDVFAKGGIDMNCQLVLCRGINDGDELRRTLDDLLRLRPQVESIAAVPAGVTAYRKGLFKLDAVCDHWNCGNPVVPVCDATDPAVCADGTFYCRVWIFLCNRQCTDGWSCRFFEQSGIWYGYRDIAACILCAEINRADRIKRNDSCNLNGNGHLYCRGNGRGYVAGFENWFYRRGNTVEAAGWRADRGGCFRTCNRWCAVSVAGSMELRRSGASGTAGNIDEAGCGRCDGRLSAVGTDSDRRIYRSCG